MDTKSLTVKEIVFLCVCVHITGNLKLRVQYGFFSSRVFGSDLFSIVIGGRMCDFVQLVGISEGLKNLHVFLVCNSTSKIFFASAEQLRHRNKEVWKANVLEIVKCFF